MILAFGLHGTTFVLVPTMLMAAVLVHELPHLKGFRSDLVGGRVRTHDHHEAWGPFALLAGVIALRSFVYFGLVTFIPLYYVADLHASKAYGNTALAAMLLGGAAGTLIGGPLADRIGRRTVLTGSMLLLPPLIVGFLVSGPVLAVAFAALAGAVTIATFAVTIVMGQEYLPGRLGVAAGVTIGLSIGLGGRRSPAAGSDRRRARPAGGVRAARGAAAAGAGAGLDAAAAGAYGASSGAYAGNRGLASIRLSSRAACGYHDSLNGPPTLIPWL